MPHSKPRPTGNVLATILEEKRVEVKGLDRAELIERAHARTPSVPHRFSASLQKRSRASDAPALIAEFKRASPSAGVIDATLEIEVVVRAYRDAGACCLSVLTDAPWFGAQSGDIDRVRRAVDLPVLRKDFIIDEAQIIESKAMGADSVLIIMACMPPSQAEALCGMAAEWGLDVLVEVHTEEELDHALDLVARPAPLIGVNNRSLSTLATRLEVGEALLPRIPEPYLAVAESGLSTPVGVERMRRAGARAILVGEHLLRHGQSHVEHATRALLAKDSAKDTVSA